MASGSLCCRFEALEAITSDAVTSFPQFLCSGTGGSVTPVAAAPFGLHLAGSFPRSSYVGGVCSSYEPTAIKDTAPCDFLMSLKIWNLIEAKIEQLDFRQLAETVP